MNSLRKSDGALRVQIAVAAAYGLGIPVAAAFWPSNWGRGFEWFCVVFAALFVTALAEVHLELHSADRLVFHADAVSIRCRRWEREIPAREVVVRRRPIIRLLGWRGVYLSVPGRRSMVFVPEAMIPPSKLRELLAGQGGPAANSH